MRPFDGHLILILSVIFWTLITADKASTFVECQNLCNEKNFCHSRKYGESQPVYLRFLGWDCASECSYQCMWKIESDRIPKRDDQEKYFGKWPFRRILGVQEPASTLMSIVNLLAHLYGYHRIYKHSYRYIPIKTTWILHEPIRLIFFSSTNAWIWSTIFHTRDTPGTMVMDYLSAIGLILANLNFAINLYFGFKSRTAQFITFISLFSLWIFHSFYMICFKFDFNWNMQFAIMLGSFYSLLMITWSLKNLEYVFDHAKKGEDEMDFKRLGKKKRSHAFCSFFATVALICVAGFEIFDFPPILWGLFDAHALWHTFTPPIILLNYYFYGRELRFQLS